MTEAKVIFFTAKEGEIGCRLEMDRLPTIPEGIPISDEILAGRPICDQVAIVLMGVLKAGLMEEVMEKVANLTNHRLDSFEVMKPEPSVKRW